MAQRKVLVTGATGYVASRMLPALRERYDLTLIDVRATRSDGTPVEGAQIANLLEDDPETLRPFFREQDAIIHLAFNRAPDAAMSGSQRATRLTPGSAYAAERGQCGHGVPRLPTGARRERPPGGRGVVQPRGGLVRASHPRRRHGYSDAGDLPEERQLGTAGRRHRTSILASSSPPARSGARSRMSISASARRARSTPPSSPMTPKDTSATSARI